MSRHVPTDPALISPGDQLLVEQQHKEVRAVTQQGSAYEFTLYNWPVRPDSIPASLLVEADATVTLILDDLDEAEAPAEEE